MSSSRPRGWCCIPDENAALEVDECILIFTGAEGMCVAREKALNITSEFVGLPACDLLRLLKVPDGGMEWLLPRPFVLDTITDGVCFGSYLLVRLPPQRD